MGGTYRLKRIRGHFIHEKFTDKGFFKQAMNARDMENLHIVIPPRAKEIYYNVRTMPRLGNTYLLQDSIIVILLRTCLAIPIQIWTWHLVAIFPRRSLPILSKTWLFHTFASLPLGSNTETSLSPTLKCQPKGVPDCISHNPTHTLHQQKPYILS